MFMLLREIDLYNLRFFSLPPRVSSSVQQMSTVFHNFVALAT